nr:cell wall protein DAN4-like [Lepeophtheirus salmonis]
MAKNPESSLTYSSILQPKKQSERKIFYRPNSRLRSNRYSFNKLKSAIKSNPIPGKTSTTTLSTSTPFAPTIPTEESSLASTTTSSSSISTSKTPTTASTSIPSSTSKTPTSRSAFRFKSKKSRISSPFLEKFLAKHRRRKGLLENVKTESTTTFKPSTSSDSDISKKSTTTTVNTTTIAPTTTTTAIPSDIVR